MLYDIKLKISYRYDSPVHGGRHTLCLTPRSVPHEQQILDSSLTIGPLPQERFSRQDFFGNEVVEVACRKPHAELDFIMNAQVERFSPIFDIDASIPLSFLAQDLVSFRSLRSDSPHHFTGGSPRVKNSPAMTEYARQASRGANTTFEAVKAIGLALNRDMKFDANATRVDTPAEEAFAQRHGVCQDFTHIMIACLRGIGVPAGYVSGFLRTIPPEGQERLAGADAMHAWVRAWCGAHSGWIEFDPTNARIASEDHVVIAYGRDYSDISPIRGVMRTSGGQSSRQSVDVVALT